MDLSLETIHRHRKNIMRKLRASNTIESISICKENKWLQQ
jgi:DNA-binding NarL/FixJ family response regulator